MRRVRQRVAHDEAPAAGAALDLQRLIQIARVLVVDGDEGQRREVLQPGIVDPRVGHQSVDLLQHLGGVVGVDALAGENGVEGSFGLGGHAPTLAACVLWCKQSA